ncbi:MAG: RidA family protein [Actinomycetota bacterium]|nr:RidA family protein [Actinomycetota bacterium]
MGEDLAERRDLVLPELSPPVSHYAHVVCRGPLVFISGLLGDDPSGDIAASGDVVAQTRQVLENMRTALSAAGAAPADVVKVTVYLRDIAHRAQIDPVRREFFGPTLPASTLVEISRLVAEDALVEIDAVALVDAAS